MADSKKGGSRKGSGRKPAGTKKRHIQIDDASWEKAAEIGKNASGKPNVSLGLRMAVGAYEEKAK